MHGHPMSLPGAAAVAAAAILAVVAAEGNGGSNSNLYKKDVGKYSFEEDDAIDKAGEASKGNRYI